MHPKYLNAETIETTRLKKFCESLSQINWDPVRYASDGNDGLDLCKDFFEERCDRHTPLVQRKTRVLTTLG